MHNREKKANNIWGYLKIVLLPIKYFWLGVCLSIYYTLSLIITIVEYMIKGIIIVLFELKNIIFYLFYGIATPFLFIILLVRKVLPMSKSNGRGMKSSKKQSNRIKKGQILPEGTQISVVQNEEDRKRIHEEEIKKAKAFIAEEKARKREELQQAKKKIEKNSKDAYINKNVKLDRRKNSIFAKLFKKMTSSPKNIANKIKHNRFSQYKKDKKDLNRQVLLINFEGDDAKKSKEKVVYQYIAKDREGNIVKDYREAFSKVEVHSYLLSEEYEVYSIKTNKWIQLMHKTSVGNTTKFKNKDLIFLLMQLSTYLKSGITLIEALRILSKQYKKRKYRDILNGVVYDLTMGDNLSDAMEKQNVAFPKLLINMVKTAEMTGELPEVLDDMVEYYTEVEQTRKQMVTALTYPTLVFIFAIAVVTFMLVFVIPQFTAIYFSMEGVQIPAFTRLVISASDFLKNYSLLILIIIIIICVIFVILYKKIRGFRTIVQMIVMRIPVIGNTIIYNEVTIFTKTFSSLLEHSVFITDSMDILNKITNNEIYKMMILDTINNLAKGDKISTAFKDHWAFPLPAYEMLVTGETTGELPVMMRKVSNYYQMLHRDAVTRLKTFIEPILTIFLTVIVGIIILAIIIPMFGMYNSIQSY